MKKKQDVNSVCRRIEHSKLVSKKVCTRCKYAKATHGQQCQPCYVYLKEVRARYLLKKAGKDYRLPG